MSMTLKDIAQKHVAKELWGFAPGREVKPVHFANKFFGALCGQSGSPGEVAHMATAKRRPGRSHLASVDFRHDKAGLFEVTSDAHAEERLDSLRAALDLVFDQDKAVYPSDRTYSFTLTHYALTSPDPSDQGTGKFLAAVLADDPDTRAVDALREALSRRDDPITRLVAPLLPEITTLGDRLEPDEKVRGIVSRSAVLQNTRAAFTRLAAHAEGLEKTAFLERAVTLGVFGIVSHVLNATDEASAGDIAPLLLCASQPADDVREASRAALDRAVKNISRAFEQRLEQLLRDRAEDALDADGYRVLMSDWLRTDDLSHRDAKKFQEASALFEQDFPLELAGVTDPFSAFLRAAVPAAFSVLGANTPDRFVLALGRLGGLVFPRAAGRGDKYTLPAAGFYDMLVSALLDPGEEVPASEFWDRARSRFGLLCGANPYVDADRLASRNIRLVSEPSLARNAAAVAEELALLGHARRYADGFTLVRAAH